MREIVFLQPEEKELPENLNKELFLIPQIHYPLITLSHPVILLHDHP